MAEKIKTSIMVRRDLWEEFRAKVAVEKGLKMLSQAVEEALEEELIDTKVAEALEERLRRMEGSPADESVPVKPKVRTDAGTVIREMRDARV